MRAIALVLVLAVWAPEPMARGQNASLPVRERIITRNFPISLPPHPCVVPSTVRFIAAAVEATSGTEYTAESCDWSRRGEPVDEINLLGQTVAEALNVLVKIDPRYAWQESDGVIMLRPLDAWVDDKHFVHESIGPIEFENKRISGALNRLRPILGQQPNDFTDLHAGNTPQSWQEFSVQLPVLSGLEALNAIARVHGNLHWELSYCKPERRRENAKLSLYTTDRGGFGMQHPGCPPPRKPGR